MPPSLSSIRQRGFTLVEMLVAMAVLAILVLLINQLFSTATQTMSLSSKKMSADAEARLIFNRMGEDFSGMLRRTDTDTIFFKQTGNDSCFFYSQSSNSQASGYYDTTQTALFPGSGSADPKSPVSLIGYRIDTNATDPKYLQLERLGLGLTWDNGAASATPAAGYGAINYLVWDPAQGFGSTTTATTLLPNAWPNVIGAAPYNISSTLSGSTTGAVSLVAPYQVIGDLVFRLEICFLLKDGSYSDTPIEVPASLPTGINKITIANAPPTPAYDSTQKYAVGCRWYNSSTGEFFICTDASAGAAVWAGAGMQDVSAIIVTMALLDANSRKLISSNTATQNTALATVAAQFADTAFGNPGPPASGAAAPQLPAAAWSAVINGSGFAQTVGLPPVVAGQVRVYQRFFYLH